MRAAIYQMQGAYPSVAARIQALSLMLQANKADLVVCPELSITGYNIGERLRNLAQAVEGNYFDEIASLAKQHHCAIVYGYPELSSAGAIYNSAACIDKKGQLIVNHRKLMIPPGFEQDVFSVGSGLTLFELNGFRCAMLICYDAEYPEAVRAAAQAGAEIIIVPTALAASWDSVALQMMPTRAFENGVWLLYANHAGVENGLHFFGGSCIVAPNGKDTARAGSEEQIISAKLTIEAVKSAQARLPYLAGAQQLLSSL